MDRKTREGSNSCCHLLSGTPEDVEDFLQAVHEKFVRFVDPKVFWGTQLVDLLKQEDCFSEGDFESLSERNITRRSDQVRRSIFSVLENANFQYESGNANG
jgi:hypothetical protein